MPHLILNGLPLTNFSGRHVVGACLRALISDPAQDWRVTVLHHKDNSDLVTLAPGLRSAICPPITRHWLGRAVWERVALAARVRRLGGDLLLQPSGAVSAGVPCPQVGLAMNPWCFVAAARRGGGDALKAALQRVAYRAAVHRADGMLYLSGYLRDAYHAAAGQSARRYAVVYAPVADDVWATPAVARQPGRVVCVSAMAPHKGAETLVRALGPLLAGGMAVTLDLIGPWPAPAYRTDIEALINTLGLGTRVRILGYRSRRELLAACAGARVFALLSRCESFGIPGLEAQALGTPVVCSDVGGMPEIYGAGAVVVPPDVPSAAATALGALLGDDAHWAARAAAARANAERFRESALAPAWRGFMRDCLPGAG